MYKFLNIYLVCNFLSAGLQSLVVPKNKTPCNMGPTFLKLNFILSVFIFLFYINSDLAMVRCPKIDLFF